MNPKISIIIRCYNEEKHIGRLLSGIREQTRRDVEIIVVDSGSTDATVAIASNFEIKLISLKPERFSFGYSLNEGCSIASGEYLVFASAHVYPVYVDWLEKLVEPFSDDKIALTYGKQRGNEVTRFSEHQIFAKWFPEMSVRNQTHPFCNNANAAIRRNLWERFPYDEKLTGLEDLAWAKQVIQSGYKIAYVADAEVVHVHEETLQKIFNRYRREAIALKTIYPHEYMSIWDALRLLVGNIACDYYHAWRDGCLLANLKDIPLFRAMQFFGTYRGFHQSGPISGKLKQAFYYPRSFVRSPLQSIDYRKSIDYTNIKHPHE